MNKPDSADYDAHGPMCDGCLIVGILALVKKYDRLAKTDSARYSRAKDVVVDLRGLLPTRVTASAECGCGGAGSGCHCERERVTASAEGRA